MKPMAKKLKTIQSLKKEVWKVFSLWVRTRDSDENGICTCITCGKLAPIKEMQAGHGIGGRHNYLLFDERICNAQCPVCNVWKGGEYEKYAVVLIKRYGLEWYEEMTLYRVKQFTRIELEQLKEKYNLN